MMSRWQKWVSTALTRTTTVVSPKSCSASVAITLRRAWAFSPAATESSRSKKTSSTAMLGALASIFSLDPGTARQVRRERVVASGTAGS